MLTMMMNSNMNQRENGSPPSPLCALCAIFYCVLFDDSHHVQLGIEQLQREGKYFHIGNQKHFCFAHHPSLLLLKRCVRVRTPDDGLWYILAFWMLAFVVGIGHVRP